MSKRTNFTTVTPLPAGISREAVMATLRDHSEMIDLNPLVINHEPCKPPGFATAEEYNCLWYMITDRVSYMPGGMVTGKISYHGCFNDLADGLQTHVYAPLGLDIKGRWTLGGNLPGEPRQPTEMGLDIPKEGLYLREDVSMKCNIMMSSFVKKNLKKSHGKLVERMVEKAHIRERDTPNASHRYSMASTPSSTFGPGSPAMTPQMNGTPSQSQNPCLPPGRPESNFSQASSHPSQRNTYMRPEGTPLTSPEHRKMDSTSHGAMGFYGEGQTYSEPQSHAAELHSESKSDHAKIPDRPVEMEG